jgi:hypothetical protein
MVGRPDARLAGWLARRLPVSQSMRVNSLVMQCVGHVAVGVLLSTSLLSLLLLLLLWCQWR